MNVWRERTGRWLRPLAMKLPISPNTITVIAFLLNVAGAACLAMGRRDARLYIAAVILVGVGGILDLLDGVVARAQQKESRFGDFLDHFLDRASDLLVTAGWIAGTSTRLAIGLPALLAVMLNGYIGTQIEATFGVRSDSGIGRAEFVLALISFPLIAFTLRRAQVDTVLFGGLTVTEWLTALLAVAAVAGILQRLRAARRLSE